MEKVRQEWTRLFSDFFGRSPSPPGTGVFPPVNLSEDNDRYYVRAELPGVMPEDIEISMEGETMTLSGEKKWTEAGENAHFHRREREAGRFRRIVTLPSRINPDGVDASFQNGVLTVTLAKAPEVKPKQIKVRTG